MKQWIRNVLNGKQLYVSDTSPRKGRIGWQNRILKHPGGCWEWLGACGSAGYGQLRAGDRRRSAHSYVYEQLVGPIPAGLEPDHLCNNRKCVNPQHIELVTHRENCLRSVQRRNDELERIMAMVRESIPAL